MRRTFGRTLSVGSSLRYGKSSNSPDTILEFRPRRLLRYSVPKRVPPTAYRPAAITPTCCARRVFVSSAIFFWLAWNLSVKQPGVGFPWW